MFTINKYAKVYFSIMNASKSRTYDSSIHEKHHIIPKSLGGSNKKENLAVLTFREHYIAHRLLTKMTDGINHQKMWYALWNMVNVDNSGRRTIDSKQYSYIREQYTKNCKKQHTEETKAKIRKNSPLIGNNPQFGEANRMFQGYFVTPWGKFASTTEAIKNLPDNVLMNRHVMVKYCKTKNMESIQFMRNHNRLPSSWIGKTPNELGFGFEKVKP